mmetsp:Transcript_4097/g.9548  ORF Transcript_4097/g.9548 Transcript_4097/m.9548 type:complete len:465 (+) Transcript_4097:52-1446(+)
MMRKPDTSLLETTWRYRGVGLVLLVPLILILTVVGLVPRQAPIPRPEHVSSIQQLQNHPGGVRYAIVFDAGSTGSRIHVFKFNVLPEGLQLMTDTFVQLKPGLSAYAGQPDKAAASLKPLMDTAMKTVPKELQDKTPLSLKATAGLRLLAGGQAIQILDAVRAYLQTFPFKMAPDAVSILDGIEEGAYAWLTLNYLLGKLGKGPEATVAAIDLGGGSVQEAFAMTEAEAKHAPPYYTIKLRGGTSEYSVYVHSYLGYGLMAGRAKIIDEGPKGGEHPCFMKGADSEYVYGGVTHKARAQVGPADPQACSSLSLQTMHVSKPCGKEDMPQDHCTFDGAWRGPPRTRSEYYVSSYFWDKGMETGIIADPKAITWTATPNDFAAQANKACSKASLGDVGKAYPGLKPETTPYMCLDLSFNHQLLVNGFKLDGNKPLHLVKQIMYNGQSIEASWALGAAVHGLSSHKV